MGATGTEPLATIRTQADMRDAMRIARVMRDVSNELCDERCGLTRGAVDKVIGPTEAKPLSPMMFDVLSAFFAVKFIMVRDPEAEERMRPKWEGRDRTNVRANPNRLGKYFLDRARPVLQEQLQQELLQNFGAKLALAFGADVGQVLAGAMEKSASPEPAPAPSVESVPPVLALAPPVPSPPESPLSSTAEAFKPRQGEPISRAHLRVVQPRHKSVRFGGTL